MGCLNSKSAVPKKPGLHLNPRRRSVRPAPPEGPVLPIPGVLDYEREHSSDHESELYYGDFDADEMAGLGATHVEEEVYIKHAVEYARGSPVYEQAATPPGALHPPPGIGFVDAANWAQASIFVEDDPYDNDSFEEDEDWAGPVRAEYERAIPDNDYQAQYYDEE